MAFKINGFGGSETERMETVPVSQERQNPVVPRKSVVQVRFPGKGIALAYYNDRFDLKPGDLVYVDGKLAGQLGRVVDVTCNFKIKVAEYKKVIAVCNTDVRGQFYLAGSHFVAFDPAVLPAEQVSLWFRGPAGEDDEYASGSDDTAFRLDDLAGFEIRDTIAQRGRDYYMENRVRYLCLDGTRGYAIVEGTNAYAVEFEYREGEIRNLLCDCFCSYACKHEFAVLLQLRELLDRIETCYAEEYRRTGYFAAVEKSTLIAFAIGGKESGTITIC